MVSATNEKTIKLGKDKLKDDRRIDRVITERLMADPQGRRWVWNRLAEASIFNEDTSLDPYYTIYQKGIRNQALRLLRDVNRFCPTQYITMTRENTGVEIEDDQDGRSSDPSPDGE